MSKTKQILEKQFLKTFKDKLPFMTEKLIGDIIDAIALEDDRRKQMQ